MAVGPVTVFFALLMLAFLAVAIFFIVGCLGLGLALAILLDQKVRFEGLFRTIFLFPFALAFIVMLPRQPMVLAGLGAGTVLTLAALSISWVTGDWGCASEVGGRLVEHPCGSGPSATGE